VSSTYAVWGWGTPDREPTAEVLEAAAPEVLRLLGFPAQAPEEPAPLQELPPARIELPDTLSNLASTEPVDRARHGVGRSYRDVVRGIRGQLDHVPDVVVRPRAQIDVVRLLDWADDARVAVIPFGGGTSVVGGVEPIVGDAYTGVVSLDMAGMSGVMDVDTISRSALVAAGTTGPQLEEGLRKHDLTARFFPQSFERSTLGGWIATRAAGHFSTRITHIDDLVESVRGLVPGTRVWDSRRLPASGAGVSPDRMMLGSEGAFGVITDASIRVQPRPKLRWSATYAAPDFMTGALAMRALMRDGLLPATARVIDARESAITGTLTTGEAAVVVGLESLGPPLDNDAAYISELLADNHLRCVEAGMRETGGAGDTWRNTFVSAPYLRETLILLGVLVETFETSVMWEHFSELHTSVTEKVERALQEICGGGFVTCRTTHAYVDGIAPYFTVFAPARRGSELAQWDAIKAVATDALVAAGGAVTHHHAIGRDHRRWYDARQTAAFRSALGGAKRALDPNGIMNPGALLDP
jgi:alkyldihydroxyacetonephosphate synthase